MKVGINSQSKTTGDDRCVATLQFRHDQLNTGVSRHGQLRPGGLLTIEYDPARMLADDATMTTSPEVVCHLHFKPGGERQSGKLVYGTTRAADRGRAARPLTFEVRIPAHTTQTVVWFEAHGPTGTTDWDSRFGQNYLFPVVAQGLPIPEPSPAPWPDASVDSNRIQVVQDSASKVELRMGFNGSRLQTRLVVRASIGEPAAVVGVWADVHVFDAMGELVHSGTIAFARGEAASAEEALQMWEVEVYPGSGGASGMGVWARPDAHTIQYRLYCQINERVFTDGVLHQFEVPADTDVRPIPGGW